MHLDHIAILVEDVEATARAWNLPEPQEIEDFPGEGTRECYFGEADRSARVLLMQPIGPGPYRRAMAKRGPGLHHIALCVDDVFGFVDAMAGSGWLLHPKSLDTFVSRRKAWLCRPGVPCLVELDERPVTYRSAYAEYLALSVPAAMTGLIDALGHPDVRPSRDERHVIVVEGRTIHVERSPLAPSEPPPSA